MVADIKPHQPDYETPHYKPHQPDYETLLRNSVDDSDDDEDENSSLIISLFCYSLILFKGR